MRVNAIIHVYNTVKDTIRRYMLSSSGEAGPARDKQIVLVLHSISHLEYISVVYTAPQRNIQYDFWEVVTYIRTTVPESVVATHFTRNEGVQKATAALTLNNTKPAIIAFLVLLPIMWIVQRDRDAAMAAGERWDSPCAHSLPLVSA